MSLGRDEACETDAHRLADVSGLSVKRQNGSSSSREPVPPACQSAQMGREFIDRSRGSIDYKAHVLGPSAVLLSSMLSVA